MNSETSALSSFIKAFLDSNLPIIVIILAFCFGVSAVYLTPREEEPQIVVPIADVFVNFPGANPQEVEQLVATPLEKLLWQIDGVEYVYSTSKNDMAIVTVRFYVGEDRERSLVKLYNKINSNKEIVPSYVYGWVIKPVEIDDVPIVTLTLHSSFYSDYELRRIGEELLARLEAVEDISKSYLVGGRPREIVVEFDTSRLAGLGLSLLEVTKAIQIADFSVTAGTLNSMDTSFTVRSGLFLKSVDELQNLVVAIHNDRPVYLKDVATITDGPSEVKTYTRFSSGPASQNKIIDEPAVTIAIAKKKGTNAVKVSNNVLNTLVELKKTVIPADVEITLTRNYGQTANQKVNDLLMSLAFAILTVVALLAYTLGIREGLVVALAVPITFSLSLFVNFLFGYSINRVTLFALILSLGLVVDDPITNVDNIQRHLYLGKRTAKRDTLYGVIEVLPPVLMSTLTIIVSFAPMFFITGMMGPYMAPMAANVPLAVSISTLVSMIVTPWATYHLLKHRHGKGVQQTAQTGSSKKVVLLSKIYRFILEPLLNSKVKTLFVFIIVVLLLVLSGTLVLLRQVPLKMLPFDNKNELQVIIDMPEGTTLERTDSVVRLFEEYLSSVFEIKDFQSYTGTSSPIDFNGMVRHYYLRKGANVADIRINLADKTRRKQQSHAIALRIRDDLQKIAKESGCNLKIVEVPPGPPVVSTIVAEVTGAPGTDYNTLLYTAKLISEKISEEEGVVDIDTSADESHSQLRFVLDKEKASLHGISNKDVALSLQLAMEGFKPGLIHLDRERQPLVIRVNLPLINRSNTAELLRISVKEKSGSLVELGELGEFSKVVQEQPIYHKNLQRLAYVFAEVAGRAPGEVIIDLKKMLSEIKFSEDINIDWAGEGEWKITIEVFRDLGLAFGAALIMIYILLVIQTDSFFMPIVIMQAIPLTIIGILPGFFLLNLVTAQEIGSYEDLVFFTATAMIGMIALGGIVVRNSIVLIEFIIMERQQGTPLKEAIIASGIVRLRPILLTAATTMLGAWPITMDPVFSGLAWSLIFGLLASTLFTLIIVPISYNFVYSKS